MLLATAGTTQAEVRLFILSGQSNMVGLKPDVSFTPTVKAAYPDDQVIVVKNAASRRLIRLWYKDWQPPAGGTSPQNGDKNGLHYNREGYATLGKRFAEKAIELATP